jgi:hypothetical protein
MPSLARSAQRASSLEIARKARELKVLSATECAKQAAAATDAQRASRTALRTEASDLKPLYQRRNRCGCDGCKAAAQDNPVTISYELLRNSTLRLQSGMAAELAAHSVVAAHDNGKAASLKTLKGLVKLLVENGAYVLTNIVEGAAKAKGKKVWRACA